MLDLTRQRDIISRVDMEKLSITMIGAGGIGSPTTFLLAKMGVKDITVYDEDGISEVNIPSQFYKPQDINQFKVDALKQTVKDFSGTEIKTKNYFYINEPLGDVVIVGTDSLESRRLVWNQFKDQEQCKYYIEGRMGAELVVTYLIKKKDGKLLKKDIEFYEETLATKAEPLPCTGRAIMYNTFLVASFLCKSFQSIVMNEDYPRENVFSFKNMIHLTRS